MLNRRTQNLKFPILLIILALLVGACGGRATETPAVIEQDFTPVASASGKVVPAQWATLSVPAGGTVLELLVAENDVVEVGQPLLRLSGGERLQAAVAGAALELVSAQQALDSVIENAGLVSAQTLQQLALAQDAVRDAQRKVSSLGTGSAQIDIDQARSNVVLAQSRLDRAKDNFAPYANKPETNLTRAALQSQLAQAQKEYDAAVRLLNNLLGTASDIDISAAQADLAYAQALLEKTQADYAEMGGGPDPDMLELANARLGNAQAQLAAARAGVHDLELRAPFAGTISAVYIRQSEWVNPGQAVIVIGDLNHLQVETTDLNEVDAARIHVGSVATVSFDALPEVIVQGTVVSISPKASPGTGVNYTVIIALSEIPAGLRWDMTAFIDIEITE